jgi:hypothetical protein
MDTDMDTTMAMRDVQIGDADSTSGEDVPMTDIESIDSKISTTTTVQDQNSLLLSLPPELRQRIWYYCLHNHEQPITWPAKIKCGDNLALGLLRTCKFIHDEAAPYLYDNAIPLFRHPSDANMFLHNHNVQLCRRTRRLLLHILDRDLPLWTGYFTSTHPSRSLHHDYPSLTDLYLVLCSTPALRQTAQGLMQAYRRWPDSTSLRNLCGSLKPIAEQGVNIKVIFFRAATRDETFDLMEACPNDFDKNPQDAEGPRLRTHWLKSFGSSVALDGTSRDNPWHTGRLF